jgi:hypothetical protein
MKMKFTGTLAFIFFISILFFSNQSLAGAKSWTGNVNTDWNNAGNWTPSSSPLSNDDITISNVESGRFPILTSGTFFIATLKIQSPALLTLNGGTLNVSNQITIENGGVISQIDGLLTTQNIELKPGGTYNQSGGELQISKKFVNKGSFNSVGGIVNFTGSGDGGSDFASGNTQFHNIIIANGADPKFDNAGGGNIKVSGNFTNNNANLDVTKATFTFNGTSSQTIYSASNPASTNTTFGNLVISNPNGIVLQSDLGIDDSISFSNGGFINPDGNTVYLNGSVYNGPLPVELSTFSAIISKNGVELKWRTETEVSNYGFEILRSSDNQKNWENIGFVEGSGNSNSPKEYLYNDESAEAGKYSYQLKQIDTDGKFELSKVVEIELGSPVNFELSQNYPNPFNPSTTIKFSVNEVSFINLTVYNSLGEKVEQLVNEVNEPGVHTVEFRADGLASGIYFYRIQAENYTQTMKMILTK